MPTFSPNPSLIADRLLQAMVQHDALDLSAAIDGLLLAPGVDRDAAQKRADKLLGNLTGETFVQQDIARIDTIVRLSEFEPVVAAIVRHLHGATQPPRSPPTNLPLTGRRLRRHLTLRSLVAELQPHPRIAPFWADVQAVTPTTDKPESPLFEAKRSGERSRADQRATS